jgi:hypothetical protein
MSATIPVLNSKSVAAHFDLQHNILHVAYRGILDASTNGNLHDWVAQMRDVAGDKTLKGIIFDFRKVVRFKRDSLYNAREQSQKLNQHINGEGYPIALVVSNYYQEQMVGITLLVTNDAHLRKIVRSQEAALDYILSMQART